MRVIDTQTLELVDFRSQMPDEPYAILSHRWSDNELSYRQYQAIDKDWLRGLEPPDYNSSLGKILWGCHMARMDSIKYFWIDTCCINKNNADDQTELSSSIMSMWKWYHEATVCYVYLATVTHSAHEVKDDPVAFCEYLPGVSKRQWRPKESMFFNAKWIFIGTRYHLADHIHLATNIAKQYLNSNESIRLASIAARLSWACGREATREEDRVYSLIGLFDVNMDIRYGEGYERAFLRLQKEIIDNDPSEDLFAWTSNNLATSGLLAPDIDCFANSGDIDRIWAQDKEPHQLTSKGMRMHILASLWQQACRDAVQMDQQYPKITLRLAAARRNKETKQVEFATITLACMNFRDSPTQLFVRQGCSQLGFEASTASGADGKRRSQVAKAEEYLSIFVRQEYIFSDAHRMELLRQRFGSFGREYKSHVYGGAYVKATAAGSPKGDTVEEEEEVLRSPSPHIGYAI